MRDYFFLDSVLAYLKPLLTDECGAADVHITDTDDDPVFSDLGNGLLVFYLVDEGDCFRYVQQRDLDTHRTHSEIVHAHAVANLAALASQQIDVQATGNIFSVFLDGHFEASLLLVDALWDRALADGIRGDIAVAVPSRDVLAFGDTASPKALTELQAVVERVWPVGDHLLVSSLFRRLGGHWTPFAPGAI